MKILHEVVTLKEGFGFGELALINDEPWSATLICAEDTEFITICADDYKQVIQTAQEAKYDQMARFL